MIRKITASLWVLVVWLLFPSLVRAQTSDVETWAGTVVIFDLPKGFDISMEEQLRLNQNASSLKSLLTEVEAGWKMNKYLSFGASYRFVYRPTFNRNRYSLITKQRYRSKPFTFKNRIKYEYETEVAHTPGSRIRDRIAIDWKTSKLLTLSINNEWFYPLGAKGGFFDQYRIGARVDFKLNKRNHIRAGYIYEQQIQQPNPATSHIFRVRYLVTLF